MTKTQDALARFAEENLPCYGDGLAPSSSMAD
jgi:hypothetical protein